MKLDPSVVLRPLTVRKTVVVLMCRITLGLLKSILEKISLKGPAIFIARKCLSGLTLQEEPSLTSRMVSSFEHMRHDLESLGKAKSRLICNGINHSYQHTAHRFKTISSSMSHGLHGNVMEQLVPLRLSSSSSSKPRDSKAPPAPEDQADPISSTVATTVWFADCLTINYSRRLPEGNHFSSETTTLLK